MAAKALEGDWQYLSEKGFDPVKITVKQIMGNDWMVACMIPKGKMMANMLKMNDTGSFDLVKFQSSQKESPQENKALEEEFFKFMENGIVTMKRDGKNLVIVSGDGSERVLSEDDIRKRHDEAQAAKLATMKGSGRFG